MNNGKNMKAATTRPTQRSRDDKFSRLVTVISELIEREFTGHLKINFTQGGIGRIEKFEEILRSSSPAE